jgi:hypothetical protein
MNLIRINPSIASKERNNSGIEKDLTTSALMIACRSCR